MTRKEKEARLLVSWLRDGPAHTAEEQQREVHYFAVEHGMEDAEAWDYAQRLYDETVRIENAAREQTPDMPGIPSRPGELEL